MDQLVQSNAGNSKIDLAREGSFFLGDIYVEPALRRLSRETEETVLEPRVMQVLVALAQKPGRILSHDDLIACCWDGLVVGDAAVNRVISILRKALHEVGGDTVQIETLSKVGYRLLLDDDEQSSLARFQSFWPALQISSGYWRKRGAIAAIIVLMCAAVVLWAISSSIPQGAQHLVLLPPEYEDEADRFWSAGFDVELRNELSRSSGLTIAGPITTQEVATNTLDASEIGRRLGADFVVRNRVIRDAGYYTVTAELIEVRRNESIWQSSIEGNEATSRSLPARLARQLIAELGGGPLDDGSPFPLSPDAAQTFLVASGMIKSREQAQIDAALALLAVLRDDNPRSAEVLALTAKALVLSRYDDVGERETMLDQARRFSNTALSIDPDSVEVLKAAGLLSRDPADSIRYLAMATELAPSDAEAWLWLSNAQLSLGDSQPSLESMRTVAALDPLWNRAWQAADAIGFYGLLEEADSYDQTIMTLSGHDWSARLAQARIYRRRGELARSWEQLEMIPVTSEGGGRFFVEEQRTVISALLDLPVATRRSMVSVPILDRIFQGVVPTPQEFEAAGVARADFWKLYDAAPLAVGLLCREGRQAELLEYYDTAFDSVGAFEQYFAPGLNPRWWTAHLSTYLGHAMQREGRDREAREFFALARRAILERVRIGRPNRVADLSVAAALSSAIGDREASLAYLRRAIDQGWPYTEDSQVAGFLGPLNGDPIFDNALTLPEFAAMIAAIQDDLRAQRRLVENNLAI